MANQHFFKPLLPGFHSHLTIPVAFFLKHMDRSYEKKTAKLRSDVSKITWEVKIEDGPVLTDGWKEFALAHNLRIGDIVVFRQERDMNFHVTLLGPGCCEIQYGSCLGKKKERRNPRRKAESSSLDPSCFMANVLPSTLRYDALNLPMSFVRANGLATRCGEIVLMNEKGRSWTLAINRRKSNGTTYIRKGWRSFCRANGLKAGSVCTFKLTQRGTTLVLRLSPEESEEEEDCSSEDNEIESLSTEPDSDEESSKDEISSQECSKGKEKKRRLIWKASSSSPSQNRFVTVTLTPSTVRDSRLYLPVPFTRMNGINEETKMVLLDKRGRNWSTKVRSENGGTRIRLVEGWKDLFKANRVKKGESIMLELIWEKDTSCVLKFISKVKLFLRR